MSRRSVASALLSPSASAFVHGASHEILGSPFQLRKLLHRHSDPQFSDDDLYDTVDMGEHAAWGHLDEPIYAEKDFEIYRPPQQQSSLPVYYIKGWLPYSADTLFNASMDVRYRKEWDKLVKQTYVVDRERDSGSEVVYCTIHLPWPFANRDYVYQRRTKYFAKQNAFVVISQAAQHANAPEQNTGVVRVETFAMRLSIRSTGTSSCDFFMEYEDDSNFSIPNYVVNWLVGAHVPAFMNDLRRACANYAGYLKTLDAVAALSTPAAIARHRAEETRFCGSSQDLGSPATTKRIPSIGQARPSHPIARLHHQLSSSDVLEGVGRRSVHLRSEANSDGDLSSSPDRPRRSRKFFQRSRDKEKDPPRRRDMLKKAHSMNKLFSTSKHSLARAPSSPVVAEKFTVAFQQEKIGLHLESDIYSNRILVAHCEKNSEASNYSTRSIVPGMVVTSVNGSPVSEIPSSKVLAVIKASSRPLTLGFSARTGNLSPSKKAKEPWNILLCTFSRDNHDLLKLFRPLDEDANVGAVLNILYEGKNPSKRLGKSPRSRDLAGRRSPKAKTGSATTTKDQQTMLVPEGAVLYEIDHSMVVSLPFAEIVHLLSRNNEPKILSFKPGLAIVGDKEREKGNRSALSKKLSMAFRWKSGSDGSPMGTPLSSKPPSKSGFKSASTTDASSILSGDATSDHDEGNDEVNSAASDHRGNAKMSLPDYSTVRVSARNIAWAWDHIHLLKNDERIFSAAMLIDKIEEFMMKDNKSGVESAAVKAVFSKMHEEREWIDQIKERRSLGVKALHEFNNEEEAEWIFGQTYFGVSTHWKPGDDGTVWLKLDGLVEGVDIFNTIAVMREIDLFSSWVPFCNDSKLVQKTGYVNVLAYISMVFPLLKRDAIVRAVGINACYESRSILLLGGSVEDSKLPANVEVPKLKGWGADRLEMRGFRVLIEPITRTKGRTCIVCNVDPKCPIPKSLLNFAIKKIAGILLFMLRKEAEKIEKAMHDNTILSDHADRLKQDPDGFYVWLRPLVDRWFNDLQDDRLPPQMKIPRPSDLDLIHHIGRSASSVAASFYSRSSSQASTFLDTTQTDSARRSLPENASSSSGDGRLSSASQQPTSNALRRTWLDLMYDFGIWPYFLLLIFSRVTPENSFLSVCSLKLIFTCTCTWLGVPGVYSLQTRQLKWACQELNSLRRKCVVLAAVLDVFNSWLMGIWANGLFCYMAFYPTISTACNERTLVEIRESENFWLMASAFTFASVVVGLQVVVNI